MVRGVSVDGEAVKVAYDDVRSDDTETVYALLTYMDNNTKIGILKTGSDYSQVLEVLGDESGDTPGSGMRAYIFLRVTTGDEMSKRSKFALLTWCGGAVPALKKAKMSLEKTEVKKVMEVFSVEIQTSDLDDISMDKILGTVRNCGGANYGTGKA